MVNYELSDIAQQNLDSIYEYGIRTWGLGQADAYFDAILSQLNLIADDPHRHPKADEILNGARRRVFGAHAIYYDISGNTVRILGILRSQNTTRLK